ncbi:hypothetical protein BDM02DRAFT_3187427 [Thelephora ganbajun]|uniref:Uncharacterized protein n=1 Tax=Thelephora ganbajun TaxID=370292 RepID=A0ACB6ZES4_THEGA|nr:hypothetical protein BDM02DRAFT_3187427 [Thelephora ganbajun]
MSFNATDDNLVLVAPRPVRLAASFSPVLATRTNSAAFRMLSATPTETLDRLKLVDDNQDTKDGQPEQTAARMSPRAGLSSEALEEFLSILRPSSFLYPSPTSPILRRRNNGATIHLDRQQSTRRGENARSPQPPSPTKTTNSVKTLTPDDFISAERLDPDHDVGSITWYPFDWRTGGPNPAHSPLRKSLIYPPFHHTFVFDLSSCCAPTDVASITTKITLMDSSASPGDLITSPFTHPFNKPNLDSPVNRAQTHNPFGKRHSQQLLASENNADVGAYFGSSPSPSLMFTRIMSPLELPALPPSVSPSASSVSLSPAAVPLPSPSPDETTELDSIN